MAIGGAGGGAIGERLRGALVLGYAAASMPFFFLVQLPAMIATGSADLSIWLARRAWAPVGLRLAGIRLEVERLAPVPDGPVIFASNHESMLDVWALFMALPRSLRFVAKAELFRIPVFGAYLRLAKFVPVDRRNHARAVAALEAAARVVRAGTSLIVFPEGTRSADGRVHAFKKGPFVLAHAARVPVVPVAIAGAAALVPKGEVRIRPGTIRVSIGAAVDPADHADKESLLREVRRRVVSQHLALGGAGGDLDQAVAPRGTEAGLRAV